MRTLRRVVGDPDTAPAIVIGYAPNPHASRWSYDAGSARRIKELAGGVEMPWMNLYRSEPRRPDRYEARARVERWCRPREAGTPLILLGRKVCDAFGIEEPIWLEWYASLLWYPMIAVPHPSGLNRWYNDSKNTHDAGRLLYALAHGDLPRREEEEVKRAE